MAKVKLVKQCLLEMYVLPNKECLRMRFSRLFKSYRGEFLTVSDNINTDYTGITLEWLKWTGICSLMDGHGSAPDTG